MEFLIKSSRGASLPQEALRRIVEAVETLQGQDEAFLVFQDRPPHDILSVHATEVAARDAASAGRGMSYIGPVTPRRMERLIGPVAKVTGCGPVVLSEPVASVVLRNSTNMDVAEFAVSRAEQPPNPVSDVEAIFLTVSALDRFMIPYLTRVYGTEYAATRRREWVKE
jgi:hypothetical protein